MICFFYILFFFSRQLFSAVSRPICTKFGTNVSSWLRFKQTRAIFEKFKNQVTTAKKHRKIGQFFTPVVTFSFVVTKRLKIFEKSFQRLQLGCHSFQKMSLRQLRTVWFKISRGSMERQKRPTLTAIISKTVRDTGKVCMKCQ